MKLTAPSPQLTEALWTHSPALWVIAALLLGAQAVGTLSGQATPSLPPAEVDPIATEPAQVAESPQYPLMIGTVVRVVDGDTYDIRLAESEEIARVRLAWADAPELAQPFGEEAAAWAEEKLSGRQVILAPQNADRYGRLVAQLTVNDSHEMWDAAATLVRSGLAWLDPRFGDDRESLKEDQSLASREGIGLWSAREPMPPWDWRKTR